MIKDSFKALGASARELFRNWGGFALLNVLYAVLLASVYVFFATGVATLWQLTLSAVTALAVPVFFFALQAATANFAWGDARLGPLARRTLRDLLKVFLLSLPLIALGLGLVYLLGKLQAHLPKPEEAAPHAYVRATFEPKPEPLHWQDTLVSTLWLLLLGLFLPLLAAHLWLSTARDRLVPTLKKIHRVAARAFAPQSIFIYAVGLFVFGLMPYFILFTRTQVSNGWVELLLYALRLTLAFVFTLWGWTITLGALARTTPPPESSVSASVPADSPTPSESVTTTEPEEATEIVPPAATSEGSQA
jgi:hypothetical protein